PADAKIRRKFPSDFVAQTDPGLDRTETGADPEFRDFLRSKVQFDPRLQKHALADLQVNLGFHTAGQVTLVRKERSRIEFKGIRNQSLDAQHQVSLIRAGA